MDAAAGREPLHARVAAGLERAFNPIMVKELRASFRGARFFVAHLSILSLFACGLLVSFAVVMSQPGYGVDMSGQTFTRFADPSRVGQAVYLVTQLLHLAVVFLVVPGFAATSVTGEREAMTHDLLLTTTLGSRQIVWGKFTAAMALAFMIFSSMVPLVGLCFLFGGITVYHIVANYVFLFGLSALVTAFSLSVSAGARSTQRAVAGVYGVTTLGGALVATLAGAASGGGWLPEAAAAYGFVPNSGDYGRGMDLFERIMYIHALPAFAWASMMAIFLLNANNRLKPHFANRTTSVRVYALVVFMAAGALALLILRHEIPPDTSAPADRAMALTVYAMATSGLGLICSLFACEDPLLPPHLAAEVAGFRGPRRVLRLFWPGSESGAAFSLSLMTVFCLLSALALAPFARGFAGGAWASLPAGYPVALAFTAVLLWCFFCASFARWLGVVLCLRPMMSRVILVAACLALAIAPLIHWVVSTSIERQEEPVDRTSGPLTLALSPAAAALAALDTSSHRVVFPLYAGPFQIPAAFSILMAVAGTAFLLLGGRAERRLKAEHAEYLRTKGKGEL